MEEEIKQDSSSSATTNVDENDITSTSGEGGIDKKDSALIKSIKDKGTHSVSYSENLLKII
jgi:hypothetical protein